MVTLAEYLLTRLRQLGVHSIHGVPGDYNLQLLDYVEDLDFHWVSNCNELNAGYAADAYARVKGLGALITTFGVGELSAVNAIAGAYAELAPVIHIVGTPARPIQDSRALIHHTFNDGEFRHFARMHAHVTVAQADLKDPRTCPYLIDSTIQQCIVHSRPVYIEVPVDMVSVPVAAENLQSKIELPEEVTSKDEAAALTLVLERMYNGEHPMILVDGESRAYGILDEIHELVKSTQWPTFTTVFGKSLVDESLPNVHGIWKGSSASEEEKSYVKSCDLILCFGPHFSWTNTYGYTSIPDPAISIVCTSTTVKLQERIFRDLPAKQFLSTLLTKLDPSKTKQPTSHPTLNKSQQPPTPQSNTSSPVTQAQFYHSLNPFFRPGDIILAETGTAGHGCRDFHLPSHTVLFKPATWLSIGYTLPATLGAALAQRELHTDGKWHHDSNGDPDSPRTILLIGDGSFQMTVQELSTIIRERLNVVIFLINNDGYTIEKCLHGWNREYNNIAKWRYLKALEFLGANGAEDAEYPTPTFSVETWGELEGVLGDEKVRGKGKGTRGLTLVEVVMGQEDAPGMLLEFLNKQKEAEMDTKGES